MTSREPTATTNLDKARIGAAWYDGNVYFQIGQQTRKARNLEVNPACTLSTSLIGIDLVFEGLAERITDGPTLETIAAGWREGGWAAEVSRDGIVAPTTRAAPGRRRGRSIAWSPTPCSASRRQSRTARHAGGSERQTVTPPTNGHRRQPR
jgi:hypothetical protein